MKIKMIFISSLKLHKKSKNFGDVYSSARESVTLAVWRSSVRSRPSPPTTKRTENFWFSVLFYFSVFCGCIPAQEYQICSKKAALQTLLPPTKANPYWEYFY